jgi:hypothetical protein
MDEIYDKIAESASFVFNGATDKAKLGEVFRTFFDGKIPASEFQALELILKKYRM